jgi:hypothetical protein
MSLKDPVETCLEGFTCAVGPKGFDRSGELIGDAVTEAAPVLVAGILKLILFFRGEWLGRGEPSSKRTGLIDRGEAVQALSGLGIDSLDSRSTSVNFANPLEDDCRSWPL